MMRTRKRKQVLAKAEAYEREALARMPSARAEPKNQWTLEWLTWHLRQKYELERAMDERLRRK